MCVPSDGFFWPILPTNTPCSSDVETTVSTSFQRGIYVMCFVSFKRQWVNFVQRTAIKLLAWNPSALWYQIEVPCVFLIGIFSDRETLELLTVKFRQNLCLWTILFVISWLFHVHMSDCPKPIFFYLTVASRKFYIWDGMNTIKCLFWNASDSVVKLMVSITSGVYRPCYKNMLNYGNDKKCWKLTTI